MARLQDDFYAAVNEEWLAKAQIPADKPATAAFVELDRQIEKTLMATLAAWADGTEEIPDDPRIREMVKLYQMARDYTVREELGVTPAKPYVELAESLASWQDVASRYRELLYDNMTSFPYHLSIFEDMQDTTTYSVYASAPELILPDKTYYAEGNENAAQLLAVHHAMVVEILEKFGYTPTRAREIADGMHAYDKSFAPFTKSGEEQADYVKMYNPMPLEEFAGKSAHFDLGAMVSSVFPDNAPAQIIVTEPDYLANLDAFVTPENFENYKCWALANTVLNLCGHLTDELRVLAGTYSRALSGTAEPPSQEKSAYYRATGTFKMVMGDYYAKTYFGQEARADVIDMLHRMIAVYKTRLQNNDWLSDETRKQAIVKLDALELHVGYPDRFEPYYDAFKVTPYIQGGTLVSNGQEFRRQMLDYRLGLLGKPVERDLWSMSPHTVNAYYNPQLNCIVFPAAILQAPFYDLDQPKSANYGGIGAVMAHEMSHAFDNNGSKFDEKGNLADWWTAEDLANFEARAQKMIEVWDGEPSVGGTVNGKLTVSENIADAGGLSCALEAAKGEAQPDLAEFFKNWARVWRFKSSEEYAKMLLAVDVHSPAKLRCNMQVRNLPEFYSTFDVSEKDGMYVAPEKRVAIW